MAADSTTHFPGKFPGQSTTDGSEVPTSAPLTGGFICFGCGKHIELRDNETMVVYPQVGYHGACAPHPPPSAYEITNSPPTVPPAVPPDEQVPTIVEFKDAITAYRRAYRDEVFCNLNDRPSSEWVAVVERTDEKQADLESLFTKALSALAAATQERDGLRETVTWLKETLDEAITALCDQLAVAREDALTPLEAGWCIESFPMPADEERALIDKLRRIAARSDTSAGAGTGGPGCTCGDRSDGQGHFSSCPVVF